jgi:hypothetical protein
MNITEFRSQVTFITRLYFCLDKFVSFYPTYRSIACPICRSQQERDWPFRTDTELLWLKRGLLRYELCYRLVGRPRKDISNVELVYNASPNTDGTRHANIWIENPFQHLLPMHELEEIQRASSYLEGIHEMYSSHLDEEALKCLPVVAQTCGDSLVQEIRAGMAEARTLRCQRRQLEIQDLLFYTGLEEREDQLARIRRNL